MKDELIKKIKYTVVIVLLSLVALPELLAQGSRPIIQFSGIIVGEDSTSGVPGVHVYVPKAGRGTTSNYYGYFSMPALAGDSVVISAVGYKKQFFVIPADTRSESLTAVIELSGDTTYLPVVDIFPYPTEELFKEAILALQLPSEYGYMAENMDPNVLALMFKNMPMDGAQNYRWHMQQQTMYMADRYGYRSNPLLNPFAWAKFIQSIKRGDLKKKN